MRVDWAAIDRMRAGMYAPRVAINQAEDDEVKFVRYDFNDRKRFPDQPAEIEISHLTDLQYGNKRFQTKRFLQYRDWILAQKNRFVVLGGDLVDAATILSVGSPYENTGEPIEQVEGLVDLLRPLADAGRLLGYVGGNHERRTVPTFGDCGRLIARQLKVPYSRGVQLIDIHFGQHRPFKISAWHGAGSPRTKGAKAQMLHRFMQQADSHVYLVGHVHDVVLLFDWRQMRVENRIKLQKIAGIISSSFQGYWNSYAETAALPPSESMMARIILERNGRWEVTLR
jgi:hypothetical protein